MAKPCTGIKMSLELRERSGLWLGKILAAASRVSGQGGTALPGRAALALAPICCRPWRTAAAGQSTGHRNQR